MTKSKSTNLMSINVSTSQNKICIVTGSIIKSILISIILFLLNSNLQSQDDTITQSELIVNYSEQDLLEEMIYMHLFGDSIIKIAKLFGTRAECIPILDSFELNSKEQDKLLNDLEVDSFKLNFNTAINLYYEYSYEKSIALYEKWMLKCLNKLDVDSEFYAKCFNNIGLCYLKLGEANKAFIYLSKSFEIKKTVNDFQNNKLITSYNNLGIYYFKSIKYFEALEFFLKASSLNKNSERSDITFVTLQCNLAASYQALKEYNRAFKCYRRLYTIFNINPKIDTFTFGLIYYNFASIYHERSNPNFCQKYLDIALQRIIEHNTKSKNESKFIDLIKNILALKAIVYMNYYVLTADSTFLYQAGYIFDEAKRTLELYKTYIQDQNSNELALYLKNLLGREINKNYYLYEATDSLHYWKNNFIISENIHHNNLFNSISFLKQMDSSHSKQDIQRNLIVLMNKISETKMKIDTFVTIDKHLLSNKLLNENIRLNLFKKQYHNIKKLNSADSLKKTFNDTPVDVAKIQAVLTEDQTFIEYIIHNQIVHVFVINKDTIAEVSLKVTGVQGHYDDTALTYLRSLNVVSPSKSLLQLYSTVKTNEFINTSTYIFNVFVKPFTHLLKKEIIIVADNNLNFIPFESLLLDIPSNINDYTSYKYFGDKYIISYAHSARIWYDSMTDYKYTGKNTVLAFAPFSTNKYVGKITNYDYILNQKDTISNLPYSGRELDYISKLFPGNYLKGSLANLYNFNKFASEYSIIHISTHSKSNTHNSLYSWIAFANSNIKNSNNFDKLFLDFINNFRIKANLVTLSSCESSTGTLVPGEGIISLASAFTLAGAKSVLSTMWKVEDKASEKLITLFYKYLSEGQPKNYALWNAKKSFREVFANTPFRHPYFWASFTLFGNIKPLK